MVGTQSIFMEWRRGEGQEGDFNLGNGEGQIEEGQGQGLWVLVRSHFRGDHQRALLRKRQN